MGSRQWARGGIYLSLFAVLILFHHKVLLDPDFIFPWDFRAVQLPLITLLRDELSHNRFALWDPYNYCGYPAFANIQACFFHPLVFLSALISSRFSWDSLPKLLEWVVVLQVWIAGVSAFGLFRAFGLRSVAAWTGAVIFETGSYFASRAEHIDSMMAAAWMPLAWLAVLKLRDRFQRRWFAVLAAALGLSIWGGFPQATVAVFGSALMFAVFLAVFRMARPRTIAWALCGWVVAILLAAAPFIPTTQLTELSVAKYRVDWLGTGGGLYWQSLVSLVAPNHYHIFDLSRFDGPWDPTFLYLYSSIGGVLLAIFALVGLLKRRNRITALFGMMLFFGMFWMLGDKTIVWRKLFPLLPEQVRIGIHPEYTYCIFSLAIAGLAAIGLDALRVPNVARWGIGLAIAMDLFLVGSGRPMNVASLKLEPGVDRDSLDGSEQLVDIVREHANQIVPPWRIDTVRASRDWMNGAPILHISSAAGSSPMAPENAIQLRLFLHDGFRWGWDYPLEKLDSPIVDLLNVRYIVARGEGVGLIEGTGKFRHIASLPGNELYENPRVFPRFFLVHQARTVGSLEEARDSILHNGVDLRKTAVVNERIALDSQMSDDDVKELSYRPNSIEVSVRASRGALLVMSETYYPGWKAWVDDQPARIYPTDIALRGVLIPPGVHRVRMEFRPVILPISLGITVLTAIGLAVLAFL